MTISVDADDTDGNVTEVQFYVDGTGVGSSSSFPYNYVWNTSDEETGSYTIKATAKDNEGASTTDEIAIFIADGVSTGNEPVTDIDGNTYKTIVIGEQEWMAQNLATTQYNDGTPIPLETNNSNWAGLSTPAYCWYNNDAGTYKATYGALYNWYAVSTTTNGGKNVCPTGWHVPTDAEWKQLEMHLGMSQSDAYNTGWRGTDEGGKLKETGTTHWESPNTSATNESGFTAVQDGFRDFGNGNFYYIGNYGHWWCASENGAGSAWYRRLSNDTSNVRRYENYFKQGGYSVRCLRD